MSERAGTPSGRQKGRGATSNETGRYESIGRETIDDGWGSLEHPSPKLKTRVEVDTSASIVSHNDSPDVPFTSSINPYRGCEHGCIYCFARPTHTYLGLSAGQDFESRLFYKPKYLARRGYECDPINLGANTDPYQPIERKFKVTRAILEVLHDCHHPVTIVTKNALVERDLDLLQPMAARRLARVSITVTTLDTELVRNMEPRTSSPSRRLRAIRTLVDAGIPVSVLVSPIIPFLNDHELEAVLEAAREAGASTVRYSMLRLPLEIKDLFTDWLYEHYPLKAERILNRVRDVHGGKIYDSRFDVRQRGQGEFARLISLRFRKKSRQLGFTDGESLDLSQFVPPSLHGQFSLF